MTKKPLCLAFRSIWLGAWVEAGDAKSQWFSVDVGEAGFLHDVTEIIGAVEIFNAFIEVAVDIIAAGEQASE